MRLKRISNLTGGVVAVAAIMAMVASAAVAATPAPGYEKFRGCQTKAESSTVEMCLYSVIKSGHFEMGSKKVPIEKPVPMTGNLDVNGNNFGANSEGGLKHVKQKVPGGVVGLTGLTWLLELLGSDALTLYAVTEAVGQPQFKLDPPPQEITLPVRVHLINPVLGNKCYVGSPANPINLQLTTGTTSPPPPNTPITGKDPEIVFDIPREVIQAKNATFVDNSFSAPGANGCTLTLFGFIPVSINGLVNAQSGLPAPAGTNETVQNIDTEFAPVWRVYP
jgi:hypothetical protein